MHMVLTFLFCSLMLEAFLHSGFQETLASPRKESSLV